MQVKFGISSLFQKINCLKQIKLDTKRLCPIGPGSLDTYLLTNLDVLKSVRIVYLKTSSANLLILNMACSLISTPMTAMLNFQKSAYR